jgi:hypothetical protein
MESVCLPLSNLPGKTRMTAMRVLFVWVYLLAGMAAVWHAPHFSQGRATLGVDHHAQHEAAFGEECALCSVKTTPQILSAGVTSGLSLHRFSATAKRRVLFSETIRLIAARPRGPPPFLS